MLVVEDDVEFDQENLATWNARAEAFLQSGRPYDMLFAGFDLGWGHSLRESILPNASVVTTATPLTSSAACQCAYVLTNWRSTHAYIISRAAMREWQSMTTVVGEEPIDFHLPNLYNDRHGFIALRPKIAFQRFHGTSIPWDGATLSIPWDGAALMRANASNIAALHSLGGEGALDDVATPAEVEADNRHRKEAAAAALHLIRRGTPQGRLPNETQSVFASRRQLFFEAYMSDAARSQAADEASIYQHAKHGELSSCSAAMAEARGAVGVAAERRLFSMPFSATDA